MPPASHTKALAPDPLKMLNWLIILVMVAIVISLGFGLYFLVRDPSGSERTVISLSIRVALAVLMLVLLGYGFLTKYLS